VLKGLVPHEPLTPPTRRPSEYQADDQRRFHAMRTGLNVRRSPIAEGRRSFCNSRDVARIRQTDHAVRLAFAIDFLLVKDRRIL
jgi:hypothetical protein